jgi:NitT/TauT family transport system substrate-binding protein
MNVIRPDRARARQFWHHAAAAAIVAALAVGFSSAVAQPSRPGLKVWRQAMIAPKSDSGFFLMAARRGFAEKEGLKIDVVDVKDDQVGIRALLSGEVDSFDSATGGITAAARGADVRIVGCSWLAAPYILLSRPGIAEMAALKGKTVAASAPGTPPDVVAHAALAASKVPDTDVKFAAVGSDRDRYVALLGGVVDAAVVANEYMPLKSSKDLHLLAEARQVLPRWVRFCTVLNGNALRARRADAVAFLSAEIKAFRYAASHREETLALTREVIDAQADDPRPAYVYDEAVKPGVLAPDFPIPLDNIGWMNERLAAVGQVPKVDAARMVDPEIRAQALERTGR